jgi:methionyl-tRNA formyltransferase
MVIAATPPLRVAFFGTPQFAVPSLAALLASRHHVVGVVTRPDRPSGRGHKVTDAPVKALARTAGVPVLQPERLRDPSFMDAFRALGSNIAVVAAYGKILSEDVLAVPAHGFVNVHASLLPRYRGAAPVHRAVIAGDPETGVTIMRVVRALDAGPMLARESRPISMEETSADVERDLAAIGARLLVHTLDELAAGRDDETPQDDRDATYAHKLTREDGIVDWQQPAASIHNLIRGLHPWPHAFSYLQGVRFILLRSQPSPESTAAPPGTILEASGDRVAVAAAPGVVHLLEIQPEGRRPMAVREFLAGRPLAAGARFGPA